MPATESVEVPSYFALPRLHQMPAGSRPFARAVGAVSASFVEESISDRFGGLLLRAVDEVFVNALVIAMEACLGTSETTLSGRLGRAYLKWQSDKARRASSARGRHMRTSGTSYGRS